MWTSLLDRSQRSSDAIRLDTGSHKDREPIGESEKWHEGWFVSEIHATGESLSRPSIDKPLTSRYKLTSTGVGLEKNNPSHNFVVLVYNGIFKLTQNKTNIHRDCLWVRERERARERDEWVDNVASRPRTSVTCSAMVCPSCLHVRQVGSHNIRCASQLLQLDRPL